MGSIQAHASSWFRSYRQAFIMALIEPPLFLLFLMVYHWLSPQTNPLLFGSNASLTVLGLGLTSASVAGLALMVRPPFLRPTLRPARVDIGGEKGVLRHGHRSPLILELISPFLKSNMWESQELARVMHKSYELMKKHVAYIRTLQWTERYTSKPSNFMMSEAISLILKLLPSVEKHSATCVGCK